MDTSVYSCTDYVDPILEKYQHDPYNLLQVLIGVQEKRGYIDAEVMAYLSDALHTSRATIEGVVGFYSFLYLQPVGKYRVLFSDNVTDRMQGNQDLLASMCSQLWVEQGKLSEDGLVSVDTTSCTGMCDQGPAMLVNNIAINQLTPERINAICELIREQVPVHAWPAEFFTKQTHIYRKELLLGSDFVVGSALQALQQNGADATLAEVKKSKVRGRGGAGFGSGMKWELCRNAEGDAHYVVCNADEGEPGTFKDRVLLTDYADMVFEGMTVCAGIIGAKQGFIYLRGEYCYLKAHLEAVLQRRREAGLLGNNIQGQADFDFDIAIHLGAGAYICGEESALIESLEGKRGNPRIRPPFPVSKGYRDQPTVVNNVETFAAASLICLNGANWYTAKGTETSTGSKVLSISGDCERPGIYEYEFGVSIQQILDDCGAKDTMAVQVGGPSGVCIGKEEFNRQIAFEDIPTAGAFMIFDHSRDVFEVARNFIHFFAHESCGFCTPCRVGTSLLSNMMDKLAKGLGSPYDFAEIEKLNQLLQATSHCGLGHTACNPVLDTIQRFRPEYEKRLVNKEFVPAFDLDQALFKARLMTGRDDEQAHLAGNNEHASS